MPAPQCPTCREPATRVCECGLYHATCAAGHHWHRDPTRGFAVIDKVPGVCRKPPAPRYDPANLVRAIFADAAGRVADAVLAELDARGLLLPAPPAERSVRDELAGLVVRVLRGGRVKKRRAATGAAAGDQRELGHGRPE